MISKLKLGLVPEILILLLDKAVPHPLSFKAQIVGPQSVSSIMSTIVEIGRTLAAGETS